MELNTKNKILIGLAVLLIIVALYVAFDRKSKQKEGDVLPVESSTNSTSSTTTIGDLNINTVGSGKYTIKQVPLDEGMPAKIPNLDRPVTFSASAGLTDEVKAMVTTKITDLQKQLKTRPDFLGGWIDLGMYQKMTGDYDGTVISWKYVSLVAPDDFVSRGNLGNLYAYYIHDNAQAEIYYKAAIARAPLQVYLYLQLAEVYRDVFKDLDKARAIVNQGLSKIPNDPNLLQMQTSLK